jgi:hypothetical protein
MALSAEWRTTGLFDSILLVDDEHQVCEALEADADRLSTLLTDMHGLQTWRGTRAVSDDRIDPETWGHLVISRAQTGEVITMDPERFWNGVYAWFRSRGVDYDGGSRY